MRRARARSEIPRVALVGYTNAGKSSLLRAGLLACPGDDRPMAGDHVLDVGDRPDPLERLDPLVDVRRHQPRLAAREDRVAGEQDVVGGHVDAARPRRVPRRVEHRQVGVAHADHLTVGEFPVRCPVGVGRRPVRGWSAGGQEPVGGGRCR